MSEVTMNTKRRNPALDLRISKRKVTARLVLYPLALFVLYCLYNATTVVAPVMMAESQIKTVAVFAGVTIYVVAGVLLAASSLSVFTPKDKVS